MIWYAFIPPRWMASTLQFGPYTTTTTTAAAIAMIHVSVPETLLRLKRTQSDVNKWATTKMCDWKLIRSWKSQSLLFILRRILIHLWASVSHSPLILRHAAKFNTLAWHSLSCTRGTPSLGSWRSPIKNGLASEVGKDGGRWVIQSAVDMITNDQLAARYYYHPERRFPRRVHQRWTRNRSLPSAEHSLIFILLLTITKQCLIMHRLFASSPYNRSIV